MDSNFYPGGKKPQNVEAPEKKPTSSLGLILGLVGLLIIVLLVAVFYPNNSKAPTVNDVEDTAIETQEVVRSFATIQPNDWHMKEQAEEDLSVLAPGQTITNEIVQSPIDPDIVYFATTTYTEGSDVNLVSIYEYNTSDYSFERLFRMSYDETVSAANLDSSLIPSAHLLGYDQGRLVMLIEQAGLERLACQQYLLSADDQPETEGMVQKTLVSMSIKDPYSGFAVYELPLEIREQAEEAVRECAQSM